MGIDAPRAAEGQDQHARDGTRVVDAPVSDASQGGDSRAERAGVGGGTQAVGDANQRGDSQAVRVTAGGDRYRYVVAVSLCVVYTFNFLDRQFLSILAEPVKHSLLLTDTQLGMLTGLMFALFYTLFGIPVSALADRYNRVRIVSIACALWSAFTAACGLATGFASLAIARMGVGVGEAGGAAPSYSIISDYFRPHERGVGLAIFSLGVPIGTMLGAASGGWIAAHYGWRTAFLVLGAVGLVLAPIIPLVVREPARGRLDAPRSDGSLRRDGLPRDDDSERSGGSLRRDDLPRDDDSERSDGSLRRDGMPRDDDSERSDGSLRTDGLLRDDDSYRVGLPPASVFTTIRVFVRTPKLVLTACSAGLTAVIIYGLLSWMPAYLIREQGMTLSQLASSYSVVAGVTIGIGTLAGGYVVDAVAPRRPFLYALLPGCAVLLALPFLFGIASARTGSATLLFLSGPYVLLNCYLAPALTVIQNGVAANQRAAAGAIFLFVLNIIGLGCGPLLIGMASDHFAPVYGTHALRMALLCLAPVFVLVFLVQLAAAWSLRKS